MDLFAVIWGDSYAMHLVPGLSANNSGLIQLTKSVCGPIIGLAPIVGKYDSVWAKTCLSYNDTVLAYIKNNKNITHVVLGSNFRSYLKYNQANYLTHDGIVVGNHHLFMNAFRQTVIELKKLGITPIVFSPPPKTGFNLGECLERMFSSALLLRENCNIKAGDPQQYQYLVNRALKEIEEVTEVVWLKDYLCKGDICKTEIDGTFIYRDKGHLSILGSTKLLGGINIETLK